MLRTRLKMAVPCDLHLRTQGGEGHCGHGHEDETATEACRTPGQMTSLGDEVERILGHLPECDRSDCEADKQA